MFPITYVQYFMPCKTLTDTESNYSNIEHEMLDVVFSILHFIHFTFGCRVHIITDHKLLITLFRKNLHATSPRLSHMLVQILDYNIEFYHQEGTKMHYDADFNVTTHDVQILTGFKSLSLDQVCQETAHDADMQLPKQHISDGLNHIYLSQFAHFMITESV